MMATAPAVGIASLTAFALLACGSDSTEPARVASVLVAPSTATVTVDDTTRLSATVKDAAGHALTGRLVTWASSTPAVATISATGLVTGVAENSVAATITATSEGVSGSALITVSPGLPLVAAPLTTGVDHACALTGTGAAYCWGRNEEGELGNGSSIGPDVCAGFPCSVRPVAVVGGLTFMAVAGDMTYHTCGLTGAGAAYCWGWNSSGQLGNGSTANSAVPVAVSGGLRFSVVAPGTFGHTCGLTKAGAAYCWGSNYFGQLGSGSDISSTTPVAVSGGLRFNTLASGTDHTCGLTDTGAVYCWGEGSWGQLGNGSTTNRNEPVAVSGGLTFSVLVAGGYGTCALTAIGTAYCWGENIAGQLGNGSVTGPDVCNGRPCGATPVQVSGGLIFSALGRGGGYHKCGLTFSGAAYCWGRNSNGQLGDSSTTNRLVPVAVSGGLRFSVIATGDSHTCALTSAGAPYCWGYNRTGELGNGSASGPDLCNATPCSVAPVAVTWSPNVSGPRRSQ